MLRRFLAIQKTRQARGSGWIQFIFNIGILIANIRLFQDTIMYYTGITQSDMIYVYVGVALLYVIISWTIGYIDEKIGIWKHENDYNVALTPVTTDIYAIIKNIGDRLNEIEEKIDKIAK